MYEDEDKESESDNDLIWDSEETTAVINEHINNPVIKMELKVLFPYDLLNNVINTSN